MAQRKRSGSDSDELHLRGESPAVRKARNIAGVASLLGIAVLTVFAFENLTPWWKETVEDYLKEHPGEDRDM